jgi:hypothetical protein
MSFVTPAENVLVAVASEIGLARAIKILTNEREAVLAALRGFEGAGPGGVAAALAGGFLSAWAATTLAPAAKTAPIKHV